ncbi:MAG: ATP-binding protein, partial [Microcystaceae cyanobacterium]
NREVPLLTRVGELVAMGRSRGRAEMALREAKEAAETANRAKSTFLANMSHELRTPLNAILGFTQLMERDPSLLPQHRNFIDIINRSGNHLLNLINDVLEMSKIEAGKVVLIEESFNFQQLLKTLYDMLHIRAVNKGIKLVFDLDPSLPIYLQTDESKLRQVLINLLGNAIKFTATGQVTLRAKVTTLQTSAIELAFAVEDTGPGIPPEEVTTLFNPFVQAQSSTQKKEGTGLGLAISRQFVQLMGGEIQVSSEWGKGSCFSFTIQAQAVNPFPPEMTPELNQTVLGILNPQQEYRILVVDDQEDNRQLLQYLLTPLGFAVRSAVEGQGAIAQWESWQPHCILMDMQMPGMDGYEATRQIRQRETGQRTVILALTASAFQEQRA